MVSKLLKVFRKVDRNKFDMVGELTRNFFPETNQEQQQEQQRRRFQQHINGIPVNTDARVRITLPTDPSVGNEIIGIRFSSAMSLAAPPLHFNERNIAERALEQTISTMDTSPSTNTNDDPFAGLRRTVATAPSLDDSVQEKEEKHSTSKTPKIGSDKPDETKGIPIETDESFITELASKLNNCIICFQDFCPGKGPENRSVNQCPKSGLHIFCSKCDKKLPKRECPECRSPLLKEGIPNEVANDLIKSGLLKYFNINKMLENG